MYLTTMTLILLPFGQTASHCSSETAYLLPAHGRLGSPPRLAALTSNQPTPRLPRHLSQRLDRLPLPLRVRVGPRRSHLGDLLAVLPETRDRIRRVPDLGQDDEVRLGRRARCLSDDLSRELDVVRLDLAGA